MNATVAATTGAPPQGFRDEDRASIRGRMRRIQEDIAAAEEKVRRVLTRIERDRHALAVWQARLAGISYENRPRQ
jgi:hypothetical protein